MKLLEAAASPAPWRPNTIHETEGEGAWGCGPLCEPVSDEDLERVDSGDWDQDAQEELAEQDADLIATLRNLAPELIGLWEAVNATRFDHGLCVSVLKALANLNAKADTL